MQSSEKPAFVAILNGLAAIKPGGKLTPEAYEVWWLAMQDWPLAEFRDAAAHLAKSVEFMPSPFHFEQLRKAGRPTAGEAWAKVLHYVRTGFYKWDYPNQLQQRTDVSAINDPLIERVVNALGGYKAIAFTDSDKIHFMERRFSEHFEAMQDATEVREALPELTAPESLKRLFEGRNQRKLTDERV